MIYVVGSVCFDIISERNAYIPGTSNPSKISARLGGVAYNIFSHLQEPAYLISALGDDSFSDVIAHMLRSEIRSNHSMKIVDASGTPSPFYIAMMESGELKLAASQMDAVEIALTPEVLATELCDVSDKDLVLIDANLSRSSLRHVAAVFGHRCRIIYEPISVGKLERHRENLRDVFLVTPNEGEFGCLLFGSRSGSEADVPVSDDAVFAFLEERNIQYLLRTRGSEGAILYGRREKTEFSPNRHIQTGDTTGAGDMITAIIADQIHRWLSAGDGDADTSEIDFNCLVSMIPEAMHAVEHYLENRICR